MFKDGNDDDDRDDDGGDEDDDDDDDDDDDGDDDDDDDDDDKDDDDDDSLSSNHRCFSGGIGSLSPYLDQVHKCSTEFSSCVLFNFFKNIFTTVNCKGKKITTLRLLKLQKSTGFFTVYTLPKNTHVLKIWHLLCVYADFMT